MRKILTVLVVLTSIICRAQTNEDFEKLVRLGELYTKNVNATGENFKRATDSLRTSTLNHLIDALIAVGEGDKQLLSAQFLKRPSDTELKYWYVLREIHYNNQSQETAPKASHQVAKEILEKEIDERWLVDNYYYRIRGGIAKLFNTADLSKVNIDLNSFGLKNDTEKAILYFNLQQAFTQRFRVLQMMKNPDKLLEFASKVPKFNGMPYYEFKQFDFEDFPWIGHIKVESYKKIHLASLYTDLMAHFAATVEKDQAKQSKLIYFNSILYIPAYFNYSGAENELKQLYQLSKKQ